MNKILLIILLSIFSVHSFAQDSKVSGKVTGENNKQLNGANVVIEGTIDGASTDSTGYYEFETSKIGNFTLIVTAIEYKEKQFPIMLEAGKNVEQNVKLSKSEVRTEEIIVTASSFTSGQQTSVTITPLEIVRIPGSDADLYRALSTFPGTNQVDEGSRITVRGGDAREVLTILDQASLLYPFVFDNDFNTSSYTTINPWGLRGINFSSGGFSAKFGNVLSAVLDLKSYEMPQGTGMFAWLGLANVGLSGVYLSNNKKFGATFDIGQTFLEPYFRINGYLIERYNPIPLARGVGGTLTFKPTDKSNLKIFVDFAQDKIGIRNTSPSYDGFYSSDSKTYFSNIKYSTGLGSKTFLSAGLSYSKHTDDYSYGVVDNKISSVYSKFRWDVTHQLSSKIELNTGAEYQYDEDGFKGTVPLMEYYLPPNAPSYYLDTKAHSGRIGSYVESTFRFTKRFFTVAGLRFDNHTLSKKTAIDPRLSLGYKIGADHNIRGAVGIYHQFPELQYYYQTPNSNLKPEEAIHYILGYEFNKNHGVFLFRVEGYYKDYKNLVLFDPNTLTYTSNGNGVAKGIDVFIKSSITNKYSAWISYSLTDSKRKQFNAQNLAPGNYDIRHTLTLVGSYNITDAIVTGLTYRLSTGKPFTPVNGSVFDSAYNVYQPIYGETNSGRFPTYQRIDMNLQYIFSFFGRFAVAVLSVNNIFNQKNLYGYTYNRDYSERVEIVTTNKRQLYLGMGIQF